MKAFAAFFIQRINQGKKYCDQQCQRLIAAYCFLICKRSFDFRINDLAQQASDCGTDCQPGGQIPVNQVITSALFGIHRSRDDIITGHGNHRTS